MPMAVISFEISALVKLSDSLASEISSSDIVYSGATLYISMFQLPLLYFDTIQIQLFDSDGISGGVKNMQAYSTTPDWEITISGIQRRAIEAVGKVFSELACQPGSRKKSNTAITELVVEAAYIHARWNRAVSDHQIK